MQITVKLLSELSEESIWCYIAQIAHWHFEEWGKYTPGRSEQDWAHNLAHSLSTGASMIAMAMNENNELIGSASLKQKNIDNLYPRFTPWLSGLYVPKDYRSRGISFLLIKTICEIALQKNYKELFVFAHNLDLKKYYENLGFKDALLLEGKETVLYKNAPVLLFKAGILAVYENIEKALSKNILPKKSV